jgi:hypothetical protein
MQAFVHVAGGLTAALLILAYVDWPARQEFLCIFASGLWALVPDFHWILQVLGLRRVASMWKTFHRSPLADLFWFHRLLDSIDTGQQSVEVGISLLILVSAVLVYYRFNNWTVD